MVVAEQRKYDEHPTTISCVLDSAVLVSVVRYIDIAELATTVTATTVQLLSRSYYTNATVCRRQSLIRDK